MVTASDDSLTQIIHRFSSKRLLVVGDVMLDSYVFGRVERLNPEAPVPILHAKTEDRATGGAGNTAKNAASLGATTTLVSVVGSDAAADVIAAAAGKEGYRAVLIGDSARPTIEKRRYIVGSQQMLRVDYKETHDLGGASEDQVAEAIIPAARQADVIIVSDYAKGVIEKLPVRINPLQAQRRRRADNRKVERPIPTVKNAVKSRASNQMFSSAACQCWH